ncbi:MAG: hypothetical protein GY940_47925, partial [bacterium]|nr:hypothetical protein [bacterium]
AILEDRHGTLLFGTRENGIFIYKDEKFFKYPVTGLENHLIIAMHEDRDGNLWIGTNNGLSRVNRLTGKETGKYTVKDGLTHNSINSITEDSEGNLWVGTWQGLNRIKKKQDGAIGFENLLKSFSINCLFEDREKSLWIGTDNSGIKRLKDGKFIPYVPFEAHLDAIPLSLFQDSRGDTWIGTNSGKLLRCREGNLVKSAAIPGSPGIGIAAIAGDAAG